MRMVLLGFLALLCGVHAAGLPGSLNSQIIGGDYVDMVSEYPEVVSISNGRGTCTSSLVGPRTLITAAHCLNETNGLVFVLKQNKLSGIVADCEASPLYKSQGHDLALCYVSQYMDEAWASIAKQGVEIHEVVTHVGYGCTEEGGNGGNDGRLKAGEAQVLVLSENSVEEHSWVSMGDGLCFGDSGGPAYRRIRNPLDEHHHLVGVNSKGNIKDINIAVDITTQQSYDFIRSWSEKNGAEICGFNITCD